MSTKQNHTPELTRIGELEDLIHVIGKISGINNGSHFIDNILDCSEKCEKLERSDLNSGRPSFVQYVISCVNACAGMADPAAEIAALRASHAKMLETSKNLLRDLSGKVQLVQFGGDPTAAARSIEKLYTIIAEAEAIK